MFYVSQRSEHPEDYSPSLQRIQLWAHLKRVPFDLMYDAGLSHIAGQIGDPRETDDWTLSLISISIAHVRVEIDTTIPLPSQVEVGRSNGTFVTVDVEYPWMPPSCAHCKEVGYIQRHCPLLPPPTALTHKQNPPPKNPNTQPPSSPHPPKKANPSNKFCFSCRTMGHLMNNCPKAPQDWTLVNRRKPPPAVDPQTTPPLAQIPLPTSNSQSGPTPIPAPSVHSQNPPASPSSTPAASSPQVDIAIDPPSMEIDTPSPTKETIIDCSDMDSSSAEVFVLALPAVFKDRPIIISNNHLPPKKPSTLSLNPFCTLPSDTPTHHPTQDLPLPALPPPSSNPEPSPPPNPNPSPHISQIFNSRTLFFCAFTRVYSFWGDSKPLLIMCTNIFFWNVRGINETDKHRPFAQWLAIHKLLMGAFLETHIKEPNLSPILNRICPGWNHVSNHDTDFDGRIVIIWKFPAVVDVLHQSRQSMTCNVSLPGDNNFTFTAVYAANTREERKTLWEEFFEIQTTLFLENKNWLTGGDLNQITHYQEHSSPAVDHLSSDMLELKDNLTQLGVTDLRFQGCANTWTNKNPSAPVTKKLDRALINDVWLESYPNSVASFLAHDFSDHSPCLIDLACPLPQDGTNPFKFQNFLPQHPSFLQVVETAWFQSGSEATDLSTLGFKIKGLKRVMKTLARDKFSDIQKRVIYTNSLLKDVQVQCLNQPNEENFKAEKDLITHWTFLRGVEEAFFKQKSRINWLRLGDQNTLFFMRVAATRNSYNSIRSLQLPCGLLVTDSVELCEISLAHFQSILSPVNLPLLSSPFQWFLELLPFSFSPVQQTLLSFLPDTTEIAKTILKLNPNKSPGPDGFTSAFFKSAWSVVGAETVASIRKFFETGFLPSSTNATILTLVPKRPGASAITDYRPISCCNTTYKTISKLLVKRLKIILPEVILPNQTAFVQGRLLIENTILASEIVQGYHKEGGAKESYHQSRHC